MNTIYCGIQHRHTATSAIIPTIPTNDPELATDIFDAEIFANTADKRAWIRMGSSLIELGVDTIRYSTGLITDDIHITPLNIPIPNYYYIESIICNNTNDNTVSSFEVYVDRAGTNTRIVSGESILSHSIKAMPISISHYSGVDKLLSIFGSENTDPGIEVIVLFRRSI